MKLFKVISAMALLSIILLSSCKKDSALISTAADAKLAKANLNYRMLTIPQPANSILKWSTGSANINSITFNGTHIQGNALHLDQFTAINEQNASIFHAIILGNVNVIPSFYNYASYLVTLKSDELYHSLLLNGFFVNHDDQTIPVEVIIDNEVQLSSIWPENVIVSPGTSYLASLYLDMGVIGQGINTDQLNSAVISEGTILISSVSNPALYNIILNNLAGGMNVQCEPETINNTNSGKDINTPNPVY